MKQFFQVLKIASLHGLRNHINIKSIEQVVFYEREIDFLDQLIKYLKSTWISYFDLQIEIFS